MANIKCNGNKEIDLLAINPKTLEKYHVESRATTKGFPLREKDTYVSKGTHKGSAHRRGLDFFSEKKFNHPSVTKKIHELFGNSKYRKILVVWNTEDNFAQLPKIALEKYGIEVYGLRGMIHGLMQNMVTSGSRDDVLRIIELVSLVRQEEKGFALVKELEKETEELVQKVVKKEMEKEHEDKS